MKLKRLNPYPYKFINRKVRLVRSAKNLLSSLELREKRIKKLYPIYSFLKDLNNKIIRFLNDSYWYIIHRTIDKYHIVDTGLKPGYYDKDKIMFHANFAILKRFIEKEINSDLTLYYPVATDINKKFINLYRWYNSERVQNYKILEDMYEKARSNDKKTVSEYFKTKDYLYKTDTKKLIELVKLRENLWT